MNIKKITIASLMLLSVAALPVQAAFVPISANLSLGSRGAQVTNLQTFLASNAHIYPAALVTGYFGSFTRAAVMQFQLYYGLPMVGWVGPLTRAKINSLIASGLGIDIYGPFIHSVIISKTNATATVSWSTTEASTGKVYYRSSPFVLAEAITNFSEPLISGGSASASANIQTSHSVTITGLASNTPYYYIIVATDASGNVSVTNQTTITTNP